MKKLLSILTLAVSVSLGYSQGTVTFGSLTAASLMSTNATSIGGSIGKTATAASGFYYALLVQTYTGAAPGTINSNPLQGWTFSGSYATNSSLLAGGTSGGTATVSGWAPGTTDYVEVVGWSANEGTTWAQVAAEIASGTWQAQGFYGFSAVGYVTSGGVGSPASPPNPLFGGTGISGFQMLATVPEPTTVALIGLGGLGLAMFRRRK